MVEKICKGCGRELSWIQQYNRYYCSRCKQYPPTCPICYSDLFWVPTYNQYYCNTCMKYPELTKPQMPPPPPPLTSSPPSPPLSAPTPPSHVPPPPPPRYSPEQIMPLFRKIKEIYENGTKEEKEYRLFLEVFKFMDEDGGFWTIGAQSGAWYYHDGKQWVQARENPPPLLDLANLL